MEENPKFIGDLLDKYALGERDFPGCNFEEHENLQYLTFDDSNLEGCKFFAADFTGSSFKNCNLKSSSFKCCKFDAVNFENADLRESLLSGAVFINCNFNSVNFDNADWYGHSIKTEEFLKIIEK